MGALRLDRLKPWAKLVKRDVYALAFAARDPRVPWYAKLVALVVAAYALSPIDLIPDFVPILGYLDDLILVPLGILLALRLIPPELLQEHREQASATAKPAGRIAAFVIVCLWVVSLGALAWVGWTCLRP